MRENIRLSEEEILLFSKRAGERSSIYMLLSNFYMQRPDEGFLRKIKSDEFARAIRDALSGDSSEMAHALEILDLFINSVRDIPESDVVENMAVNFTKLFRGIKKGYGPPPPYESVWRREGRVMGEYTQKVLRMYSEADLGMDISDELPDYIGIELKFMSLLSWREKDAWNGSDINELKRVISLQSRFLNEHIMRWVPQFLNIMQKETDSAFYKAVAILTKGFLDIEGEYITEVSDLIN